MQRTRNATPRMMYLTPPQRRLAVAILALLLPFVALGTARSQTPEAAPFTFAHLDGVQRAGMRVYAFDIDDLAGMIVDAERSPATALRGPRGLVSLSGIVAQFASPEQAAAGMLEIRSGLGEELAMRDTGELRFLLRAETIAELGDQAVRVAGNGTSPSAPATLAGYLVQDGTWVYLSLAVATTTDADNAARGLVEFAVSHAAGNDIGQHQEDGSSSGGLWAKLPGTRNQAELSGMVPLLDIEILGGERTG